MPDFLSLLPSTLQVRLSNEHLPRIQATIRNLTARLEPFQYLHYKGLYTALSLRQVGQELRQLETDVASLHKQSRNAQTLKLSTEVKQNGKWKYRK